MKNATIAVWTFWAVPLWGAFVGAYTESAVPLLMGVAYSVGLSVCALLMLRDRR